MHALLMLASLLANPAPAQPVALAPADPQSQAIATSAPLVAPLIPHRPLPMPSVPEMSRFWSSFETALKNVTSGRQGVDEALDTAAKRIVQ